METELERLRKKVENFPSASLYNRLAELARQAGDEVDAENVCRRCIKEFPRSGQAYVILAEMKHHQNKKAEAIHLLQQGIDKDPRSYAAHRLMAELTDNKDVALHHLRQILGFKPNDPATVKRITELGGTSASATTTARYRTVPGTSAQPTTAPAAHSPALAPRPAAPAADGNAPLPFPASSAPTVTPSRPAAGVALRPAVPQPAGTVTTLLRQMGTGKGAILDALAMEAGVRGACIVDAQGRVLLAKNLVVGQDELLAALSADIFKAAAGTLGAIGVHAPTTWVLVAHGGQVLTFHRDSSVGVVVFADPGVRPAMLELRARQALIDLGAA